jgi:hypothetical protein
MYWICLCFHLCPIGIQLYNNTEATLEKIWKTVETVWNETSSSEVARAFVLAYRVIQVIIADNGNNSFLAHDTPHCNHDTPHCNVRMDFIDTPNGITTKLANLFL